MISVAAVPGLILLRMPSYQTAFNRRCCANISKVVTAVANFFRTIGLWFFESALWLLDRVVDLMPDDLAMSWDDRRLFIRAVLNIAPGQRASVLEKALPLISPEMSSDVRTRLLKLLIDEDLSTSSSNVLWLITLNRLAHYSNGGIIGVIASIPTEQRDACIGYAYKVINNAVLRGDPWGRDDPSGRDKHYGRQDGVLCIISAIAEIPEEEREEAIENVLPLITPAMSAYDRVAMIQSVTRVPVNERAATIDLALDVITEGMDAVSRRSIVDTVSAIPEEEREEVIENALPLITPAMSAYDRVAMIQSVTRVPVNERAATIALALDVITEDMDAASRRSIVETVAAIPAGEREAVVRKACLLITPAMNAAERLILIQGVTHVPVAQRDATIALALDVITEDMDAASRRSIVETVAAIPAGEREAVVRKACLLITPAMNAAERLFLIRGVTHVPVAQRDATIAFALDVITEDMNVVSRLLIVYKVAAIPAGEREAVVRYSLRLITPEMPYSVRMMILGLVQMIPANQRAERVQQYRQDQRRLFQDLLYHVDQELGQGIDVHEEKRDQQVREAIELLRQHQGEISGDRIKQAAEEFIQYLEGRAMNAADKRLAQDALLTPQGLGESFGPLISETKITILGLEISGKEMIGRLWVFASELPEPDQTYAKEGMIIALKESYDHGERVCNQGKVQRLVVRVLQGHLAGVDIELFSESRVSTQLAMQMFFYVPGHSDINQRAPLLDAAKQYCDENPFIIRDDFIRGITGYADAQGF